ncbi:MAG: porin family protein [Opitutaceae bacterium]|jgi:hypothetical protein|nr:porin family protein [Opitutaceae bacterium]
MNPNTLATVILAGGLFLSATAFAQRAPYLQTPVQTPQTTLQQPAAVAPAQPAIQQPAAAAPAQPAVQQPAAAPAPIARQPAANEQPEKPSLKKKDIVSNDTGKTESTLEPSTPAPRPKSRWGITGGYNYAKTKYGPDVNGWQLGIYRDFAISERWSVIAELLYVSCSYSYGYYGSEGWLTLPVNMVRKFPIGEKSKFLLFGGLYISRRMTGIGSGYTDHGANLGLGVQFSKFLVKAQYSKGLGNEIENALSLSAGWSF